MSTQNVNVARFARNVKWDFFWDFQTPCYFVFILLSFLSKILITFFQDAHQEDDWVKVENSSSGKGFFPHFTVIQIHNFSDIFIVYEKVDFSSVCNLFWILGLFFYRTDGNHASLNALFFDDVLFTNREFLLQSLLYIFSNNASFVILPKCYRTKKYWGMDSRRISDDIIRCCLAHFSFTLKHQKMVVNYEKP